MLVRFLLGTQRDDSAHRLCHHRRRPKLSTGLPAVAWTRPTKTRLGGHGLTRRNPARNQC